MIVVLTSIQAMGIMDIHKAMMQQLEGFIARLTFINGIKPCSLSHGDR